MSADPSVAARLESLEVLLSHLQHDVDKLDEAILLQRTEIEGLRQSLARLAAAFDDLPHPPMNHLDERPPHY